MNDQLWADQLLVGQPVPPVRCNLTRHRLVMRAGGDRDFVGLHYDDRMAQAAGARGAFINNVFALGLWERAVREFIGPAGAIHAIRGLRMSSFNVVGDELVTSGEVTRRWEQGEVEFAELTLRTTNGALNKTTVGPGVVVVSLPKRHGRERSVGPRYAADLAREGALAPSADSALTAPWDQLAVLRGQNLLTVPAIAGADRIEQSVVRRLCEPLELGSSIHYEEEAARRFGHDGIVAPLCGLGTTYVDPGSWRPGQPTQYPVADPDALPPRPPGVENGAQVRQLPMPEGSVAILTEVGLQLITPIYVGDLLSVRAVRLIGVVPKCTSIGDGAFLTFVNDVWNEDRLVGRVTKVQYQYQPRSE